VLAPGFRRRRVTSGPHCPKWRRFQVKIVSAFAFSAQLDPVRAGNLANYAVTELVPEFSNSEGLPVMLLNVVYNPGNQTVLVILARQQLFASGGQIVVNSAPPAGVTDLAGNYLDGSRNGLPGSPAALTILPGASGIVFSAI